MSAPKLSRYFTRDNPRKVVGLTDDAPAWLRDAIHAALHVTVEYVDENGLSVAK